MSSTFQMAMLIPATVFTLLWIWLAARYESKFASITQTLEKSEYPLHELFYIGFQILERVHFNTKSDYARQKVKEMSEVYGRRYAEYYYYVQVGGQVTYAVTVVPLVFVLAVLGNSPMALLFGLVMAFLLIWYMSEMFKDKLTARREEMLADFPQVLSKLTLLVNSGMTLRNAWNRIAADGTGNLYREMAAATAEMQNGISEPVAYQNFAERCGLKEMRKFASMVTQSMAKGSGDLSYFLKDMSDEMWEMKKNMVKRKSEQANSKLLLPIVLIFVGILIMIMAPVLGGL
ncbi:MAG TPA: type II secretion system F family protein [Candidatus Eisenbergiella pullicola]|nr:type II secretion system F family protein [Candidatus Eisenbergiella pullicola]